MMEWFCDLLTSRQVALFDAPVSLKTSSKVCLLSHIWKASIESMRRQRVPSTTMVLVC